MNKEMHEVTAKREKALAAHRKRSAASFKLLGVRCRKAFGKLSKRDLVLLSDQAGVILEGTKVQLVDRLLVKLSD